jgi:hypothetical protein
VRAILAAVCFLAACGDNDKAALYYTDPPAGGALRLVRDPASTDTSVVLDFIVGDQPLVGYSTGFDLPLDAKRVTLKDFTPGTALDPGSAPAATAAAIPSAGPLASNLVVALSQKATGGGAVATNTALAPGALLFKIRLDRVDPKTAGVIFDGLDPSFHLPSGGLRDRAGMTVVAESGVAIGRLEILP